MARAVDGPRTVPGRLVAYIGLRHGPRRACEQQNRIHCAGPRPCSRCVEPSPVLDGNRNSPGRLPTGESLLWAGDPSQT